MRKFLYVLFLSTTFWSCVEDDGGENFKSYEPILMKRDEFEKSIKYQKAHSLRNIAKMYTFGDMIFISEQYKGVHLIDNSNPKNPVNKGFLQIPGCIDIAYKSNVLYVSGARDLIAIDISDYQNPKELSRQKDVFPELKDPNGGSANLDGIPANTVLIDWLEK